MKLIAGSSLHGFNIKSNEELPEIEGRAIEGVHVASGARLLYLQNADNNKSFAIGFRTPPRDNTGVFHILEHSVLCGSRRFPVKEPFVDLLKGSMQTFLNAMTFADKTLYPVASTNEQDLLNLMDVYLDAVFHPNIYEKRAIFEQEGWRYELQEKPDVLLDALPNALSDTLSERASGERVSGSVLTYNGVVYNEMKGALSDATSVLYDEVQAALFPGTCYAFESGGTPAAIPTLTYEDYLDEHRRHYRTDNSYVILYGNLDISRVLAFIDERYLTPVAAEQRERDKARAAQGLEPLLPREIDMSGADVAQTFVAMPQLSDRCGGSRSDSLSVPLPEGVELPVSAAVVRNVPYVRKEMETAPENACAACGYVVGTARERTRVMAADILLDALLGSNESPLKRALLDAGVAHDVHSFVSDALARPFAVIQLQMPAEGAGEKLFDIVKTETEKLLEAGLDHEFLEATLSHEEFQMREHDMGAADGVINSMIALSGWLYDEDAATDYLRYEDAFKELRCLLNTGYFEQLAAELFCGESAAAAAEIIPVEKLPADDAAKRLAEKSRSLTEEERERIAGETALLRELQEAPDAPEAVATLPRLAVTDIEDAPPEPAYDLDPAAPITCVRHRVATNGIAYAYRYFNLDGLSFDELPYVSVLALVLGKLDTARHSAAEIDTLVQGKLGNLSFFTDVYEHRLDSTCVSPKFVVSSSALEGNTEWLSTLVREILLETDFSDAGKIFDILKQRKIGMEQGFANSGHTCASARLKSYYSQAGVVREQLGNVGFYRFLCELIENYDARSTELAARLAEVSACLLCDNRCTVSFAGSDDAYDRFWLSNPGCGCLGEDARSLEIPASVVRNEAFIVPSDVCYAAAGWDWRSLKATRQGAWAVAARALSLDYLWNEVRVKGGAYGVGFQTTRSGNLRFYSYRDPHLDETLARFEQASEWLDVFDPTEEDREGFVVATVASLDAPMKPRALIRRQMGDFFTQRRPEERLEFRRQAINSTLEDMRTLAPVIREALGNSAVCVFGNREILEASQTKFDLIPLF